jgi:hypothetical protein
VDLDAYRAEAEAFSSSIGREYYLHLSGQKLELETEAIYDEHASLFSRDAVEELRGNPSRELLEFAVEGLIGRATEPETAEVARREATLEVAVDGERLPFRQAAVEQANEPDAERRLAIERARLEVTMDALNPLLREVLERSHALATELGWPSMRALCEELSGLDLGALERETAAFLEATEEVYEPLVEPRVRSELGLGFEELRRADLAAFFRSPSLDDRFPAERLEGSLHETLDGLGLEAGPRGRVRLDTEARPTKSPRAFCSPVRVPNEVYLVLAPIGGRDDYETLLHEAGHAYHYAHVDPGLPFEHRYLGDNSVTEGFAFLLESLAADPEWLRRRLGAADVDPVVDQSRAVELVFLRRYSAKLAYELALHGPDAPLDAMPATYARRLSEATHVSWPEGTWLSDVDPFFYAARYLRAWAFDAELRALLLERFGDAWFDEPAAGELLAGLWREGQRQDAAALLEALTGRALRFGVLLETRFSSG